MNTVAVTGANSMLGKAVLDRLLRGFQDLSANPTSQAARFEVAEGERDLRHAASEFASDALEFGHDGPVAFSEFREAGIVRPLRNHHAIQQPQHDVVGLAQFHFHPAFAGCPRRLECAGGEQTLINRRGVVGSAERRREVNLRSGQISAVRTVVGGSSALAIHREPEPVAGHRARRPPVRVRAEMIQAE